MKGTYYLYFIAGIATIAAGTALALLSSSVLNAVGISAAAYGKIADTAVLLVFGYAAIKLLSSSILDYGRHMPRVDEKPLARLTSLLGYVVLFFLLLTIFGINFTGVLIGAGFLGIVIGLASQSTLGNLFAGISMMASKPFAIGDRVTFSTWQYGTVPPSYTHGIILPGYSGIIEEMGMIYTKLKLDDGTDFFVPNGIMNQAAIINYSISDTIYTKFRVELPMAANFDEFKRRVLSKIDAHKKLKKALQHRALVMITDVGLASYGVTIGVESKVEDEERVKSEIADIALKVAKNYVKKGQ
jgi:small-conductance mechanosensitive channel